MQKLNFAIVGCGRMGKTRAAALHYLGAGIRYSLDCDESLAKSIIQFDENCTAITHVSEIDWKLIDGVFICTPPGLRGQIESLAFEHRKSIFVEKPLHISIEKAKELKDRFSSSEVLFAVGYMNRYRHSVNLVKRHLANLGVIGFQAHWICKPYGVTWWKDKSLSGGPLNEQATHLVDLARFFFGTVTKVSAFKNNDEDGIGESVCANLSFENNISGSIIYSCCGSEKDIAFQIFTKKGSLCLSGWDLSLQENSVISEKDIQYTDDIFRIETSCFLKSVHNNTRYSIKSTLDDAFLSQLVISRISQSVRDGETH
ncbi:MAG: hypothetical protein CBARDCOR_4196 [uncultured Caballeronia sp.]|nr:MAG: hypothetical protein CBARDCOR_4196 [uncultured Caballeronia sp.]